MTEGLPSQRTRPDILRNYILNDQTPLKHNPSLVCGRDYKLSALSLTMAYKFLKPLTSDGTLENFWLKASEMLWAGSVEMMSTLSRTLANWVAKQQLKKNNESCLVLQKNNESCLVLQKNNESCLVLQKNDESVLYEIDKTEQNIYWDVKHVIVTKILGHHFWCDFS
jgi:hypothetical protein